MDKYLLALIRENSPKLNPDLAFGLATKHVPLVAKKVDSIFRTASAGFPEGLKYEGYVRCTPEEEYRERTRKVNNQHTFECALSMTTMYRYLFSYMGQELEPRYLELPYVNFGEGGLITLRGSTFSIAPVLADKIFSVGSEGIFIPLQGAKLTFERVYYTFSKDSELVEVHPIWSPVYNRNAEQKKELNAQPVRGHTTMVHYLFCKYGVEETFNRYGGTHIVVGDEHTINQNTYPKEDWVICASSHKKPDGVRSKFHPTHNFRMAIPRGSYTDMVHSMVGVFFYVLDHFPDRFDSESLLDTVRWQLAMAIFIFGAGENEGLLLKKMDAHLESLDTYLDEETRDKMHKEGIFVRDVYDMFMHIVETFHTRLTGEAKNISSMYDKQLMILRYITFDINMAVYNFSYALRNMKKAIINPKDIITTMRKFLRSDLIYQLNQASHGEVASVTVPGDNMVVKITSRLVPQTNSAGGGLGHNSSSLTDPAKHLHVSNAAVGSFRNMTKSEPTGRDRINGYLQFDADGVVLRDPALEEITSATQARIQRR